MHTNFRTCFLRTVRWRYFFHVWNERDPNTWYQTFSHTSSSSSSPSLSTNIRHPWGSCVPVIVVIIKPSNKEQHFWGFYVPAVLFSFPGVLASPPHYCQFFGSLGCRAPSHLPGIKSTLRSGWTLDVDNIYIYIILYMYIKVCMYVCMHAWIDR
jgi:hypothetical protein